MAHKGIGQGAELVIGSVGAGRWPATGRAGRMEGRTLFKLEHLHVVRYYRDGCIPCILAICNTGTVAMCKRGRCVVQRRHMTQCQGANGAETCDVAVMGHHPTARLRLNLNHE